jgi:hypothetical protein
MTVAGLLIWGALSHERTGLPFAIATGPRQRSHFRVRVPWDSRPYFLLSQIRDFPFRRLLRLARSRWRYSTPPPYELPLPNIKFIKIYRPWFGSPQLCNSALSESSSTPQPLSHATARNNSDAFTFISSLPEGREGEAWELSYQTEQ